ncbi:TPA: hypothetical protein ACH3X1_011122 [Trebouxia sp. C0004]
MEQNCAGTTSGSVAHSCVTQPSTTLLHDCILHHDTSMVQAFHIALQISPSPRMCKWDPIKETLAMTLVGKQSLNLFFSLIDALSQGYTNLQSLVKCLDHKGIVSDTVCSQARLC